MQFEIVDAPLRFVLCGRSAEVPDHRYGEVGMQLMGEMWGILKETETPHMGLNHWVYPPATRMFVGVELAGGAQVPEGLETLEFSLGRRLTHDHIGPYQALPAKWAQLKQALADRGETPAGYALEIYGHHCDDPKQSLTTILIGLK